MGTGGEFLFGVPKETFSRLNAVYDREVTPRLKEGVFLDRQSFLLGHLDEGEDLALAGELAGDAEEPARVWERLRRRADDSDGAFVLSAPLKTADGVALGSVYLKRQAADRQYFREDERLQLLGNAAVAGGVLAFTFLWILLPTWVYVDARERGVRRAPLFAFLTVISSLVGLVVYLISRPDDAKVLVCPGCGKRGERRRLLPALRAGPLGLLLRDLPLPAEAGLGLLPLVPDRDRRPERPRPRRPARKPLFSNRTPARSTCRGESMPALIRPSSGGATAVSRPLVAGLFVSSVLLSVVSWYTTQQGMALYLSPWFSFLASSACSRPSILVAWLVGVTESRRALLIGVVRRHRRRLDRLLLRQPPHLVRLARTAGHDRAGALRRARTRRSAGRRSCSRRRSPRGRSTCWRSTR